VQDTEVLITHDKLGSLMCPVFSIDTWEHFSWGEPYLYIVDLVCVRGIKLAISGKV